MMGVYLPLHKAPEVFFLVDRDIYETYGHRKWFGIWDETGQRYYVATYRKKGENFPRIFMPIHRLIMNAQKGQIVDHKDTNGLNNLRENLRFATSSQNQTNGKKRRTYGQQRCTSRFKGVSWHRTKTSNHWLLGISTNGKWIHVGVTQDEEEAARMYNRVAQQYYGEFAKLNEVTPRF